MRILLTSARFLVGGTETYSVTVAEQLERLGHTVTVHAGEASPLGRELAESRGLRLSVGDLPELDEFDVAFTQDRASAYELAARRPDLGQVHGVHGLAAYEQPPSDMRPPPTVVVFNDRIARHAAALASHPPVARLRQPIDLERFRPRRASRPRARRVLMLSNRPSGARLRILEQVCSELGLELTWNGGAGTPTLSPQEAMSDADVVIGYGRSVLEGMAMGCAAYVWDRAGGDGWVTPESYPSLEADGFSGAATDAVIDADRLRTDLAGYRPELGEFAYDLARQNHSATKHAEALAALLEEANPTAAEEPLETLALLVRLEARAAIRADGLEFENGRLREHFGELVEDLGARLAAAEHRAAAAEEQLHTVVSSRSWRLAAPLRNAAARLRGRRT